jgi:hypothetical protein
VLTPTFDEWGALVIVLVRLAGLLPAVVPVYRRAARVAAAGTGCSAAGPPVT